MESSLEVFSRPGEAQGLVELLLNYYKNYLTMSLSSVIVSALTKDYPMWGRIMPKRKCPIQISSFHPHPSLSLSLPLALIHTYFHHHSPEITPQFSGHHSSDKKDTWHMKGVSLMCSPHSRVLHPGVPPPSLHSSSP